MQKLENFRKVAIRVLVILACLVFVCGTGSGIYFYRCYASLLSSIEAAENGELAEIIRQHEQTILKLQGDLGAARGEIITAIGRADTAERIIDRAFGIAERSDAEFIEFGNAMAISGSTITEAVERQQRINASFERIQRNNTAIKDELRMRP